MGCVSADPPHTSMNCIYTIYFQVNKYCQKLMILVVFIDIMFYKYTIDTSDGPCVLQSRMYICDLIEI